MNRTRASLVALTLSAVAAGCGGEEGIVHTFDFEDGADGWIHGFADLPTDADEEAYELRFAHQRLPAELDPPGAGLLLRGRNHSDDLFMFIKRELTGLQPGASYVVHGELVLASSAPSGCFGIGGAPGENVYLKLGASSDEPEVIEEAGWLVLSVDKGNQASDGERASTIGTIENGLEICETDAPYRRIERGGSAPPVRASSAGSLWVFTGTDSGFEGTTSIYYDRLELTTVRE
jgi:hypothetical protein